MNFVYMKEIASGEAYNGRSDLGNTQPGDGPKYKGAGVLQLTGRHNYQRLANGINDQKVMDGVDYVSETYPFTSARIWIEENKLLDVCLTKGFDSCCVKINGGWNGYDDRLAKYRICHAIWSNISYPHHRVKMLEISTDSCSIVECTGNQLNDSCFTGYIITRNYDVTMELSSNNDTVFFDNVLRRT